MMALGIFAAAGAFIISTPGQNSSKNVKIFAIVPMILWLGLLGLDGSQWKQANLTH